MRRRSADFERLIDFRCRLADGSLILGNNPRVSPLFEELKKGRGLLPISGLNVKKVTKVKVELTDISDGKL